VESDEVGHTHATTTTTKRQIHMSASVTRRIVRNADPSVWRASALVEEVLGKPRGVLKRGKRSHRAGIFRRELAVARAIVASRRGVAMKKAR